MAQADINSYVLTQIKILKQTTLFASIFRYNNTSSDSLTYNYNNRFYNKAGNTQIYLTKDNQFTIKLVDCEVIDLSAT